MQFLMDSDRSGRVTAFLSIYRAERLKIRANWISTLLLVWSLPALTMFAFVLTILLTALLPVFRQGVAAANLTWTEQALFIWGVPNTFLGRALLAGYAALIFAAEYRARTWKHIVPRANRAALWSVKFPAYLRAVLPALLLMSLLSVIGTIFTITLADASLNPPLTDSTLPRFAGDFLVRGLAGLLSLLLIAGYVALGVVITRAAVGGWLLAMLLSAVESQLLAGLILLDRLIPADHLLAIYPLTPGALIANLESAFTRGTGIAPPNVAPLPIPLALFMLALWAAALMLGTMRLFQQQDITT